MTLRKLLPGALALTVLACPLPGSAGSIARIDPNPPGENEEIARLHDQMLLLNAEKKRSEAIALARDIVERAVAAGGDATQATLNLGLLMAAAGDIDGGIATVDGVIESLETESDVNAALIRPLEVKGVLHRVLGQPDAAEEALRRAQHIIHRVDGVFSTRQRDILDEMTILNLTRSNAADAIREQGYAYLVSTHEYGEQSDEVLPYTYRYAAFLADHGQFTEAIKLLENTVDWLSRTYGKDDKRLIRPLRDIADVRLLQREVQQYRYAVSDANPETRWLRNALGRPFYFGGTEGKRESLGPAVRIRPAVLHKYRLETPPPGERPIPGLPSPAITVDPSTPYSQSVGIVDKQSYRTRALQAFMRSGMRALQQVVEILDNDDAADTSDRIDALVDLADMHMISGSVRAFTFYREAWQKSEETPAAEQIQASLFGSPTRIQPRRLAPLPLDDEPLNTRLTVAATFSVDAAGNVGNLEVAAVGLGAEELRDLKQRIYLYRYRPRMVDAEFVATDNVTIEQVYIGTRR